LAAHLKQAHEAYLEVGEAQWSSSATQELITLLRDDYATLMSVLGALEMLSRFETEMNNKQSIIENRTPKALNEAIGSKIGYVVGGGLKENLHVRLTLPAQEVQEGAFRGHRSG